MSLLTDLHRSDSYGAHGGQTHLGGTGNHPHQAPHGAHNPASAIPGVGGHPQHAPHGTHSPATTVGGHGAGVTTGTGHTTNAGPHNSAMANKIDPRVDSDRDGRGGMGGAGIPGAGHHPQHAPQGAHNPGTVMGGHGSSATPGSGTATNAGPHNSAMMNKLDPRVDSDVDGSGTYGGNATRR